MNAPSKRDLIVLVPDDDIRAVILNVLARPESLGTRKICFARDDVAVHPGHDPKCYREAHEFLRDFHRQYEHALVVFDHQGCGSETDSPEKLEREVETALQRSGWDDRAAAVVIEPEVENWVWSESPHVVRCLRWEGRGKPLRTWLEEEGLWPSGQTKPPNPKTAFRRVLWETRRPPSSAGWPRRG